MISTNECYFIGKKSKICVTIQQWICSEEEEEEEEEEITCPTPHIFLYTCDKCATSIGQRELNFFHCCQSNLKIINKSVPFLSSLLEICRM